MKALLRFPRCKPSFVLRPFIGPQPAPKPTGDKLDRIMGLDGVGKIEGNPLLDPLYLEAGQANERDRVMQRIANWRSSSSPFEHSYDYVKPPNGPSVHTYLFVEQMNRKAYDALVAGATVREVAANCFMTLEEAQAIKDEYNL